MQVTPKAPNASPAAATQPSQAAQTARDRAIARLVGAAPQVNQNAVAPEEVAAVTPEKAADSGQINTIEDPAAVEATTPKAAVETPLSAQYAQLARKEKAIRDKAQGVKAQEVAFAAEKAAWAAEKAELAAFKAQIDRLDKEPLAVMAERGITYDKLTEQALNQPSAEESAMMGELKAMRAEIAALKGESETNRKSAVDQQTRAYQQAVAQIAKDAKALIDSDAAYETIKATDSTKDVVELIERTFKEDGTLLTIEEAAIAVEEYLVEEGLKFARLNKIQQKLKPATPPVAEAAPKTQGATTQQPIKTLTNAHGASRQLTAKERAVLAFKGELNKS